MNNTERLGMKPTLKGAFNLGWDHASEGKKRDCPAELTLANLEYSYHEGYDAYCRSNDMEEEPELEKPDY